MCTLSAHRQEDQGTHMCLGMDGEVVRPHACVPVCGCGHGYCPTGGKHVRCRQQLILHICLICAQSQQPLPVTSETSCAGRGPLSHISIMYPVMRWVCWAAQSPRRVRFRLPHWVGGEASPLLPQSLSSISQHCPAYSEGFLSTLLRGQWGWAWLSGAPMQLFYRAPPVLRLML